VVTKRENDELLDAVSYRRISSDKSGRQIGVDDQLVQIEDAITYGAIPGVRLVGDYCDPSVSAGLDKRRPAFDRLWADVESGKVRAIVCRDFDRLFRDDDQWTRFTAMLDRKRRRVELFFVKEGPITVDPVNRPGDLLVPGIKAQMAAHERRLIRSRALGYHERRRRAGKVGTTMRRRFGYTRSMEVVESEAAVIREMAKLVLDGESLRSIAKSLNERGVPTSIARDYGDSSGHWYASTIRSTLLRPDIAGLVSKRDPERASHYVIVGEGTHEAIVDVETWHRVRHALGGDKAKRRRSTGRLLSGLVTDVDGKRLTVGTSGGGRSTPAYRSGADGTGVKGGQRRTSIDAAKLEGVVVDLLLDRSSRAPLVEATSDSREQERLTARLAKLDAKVAKLRSLWTRDLLDDESFEAALDELRTERREIEHELARVDERLDDDLADLLRVPGRLVDAWGTDDAPGILSDAQKRRIVEAVFASVIVHPGTPGRGFDPERIEPVPVAAVAKRWKAAGVKRAA
jgi:DNA invertase Pin-like site-specific DNA recombinase